VRGAAAARIGAMMRKELIHVLFRLRIGGGSQ